MWYSEFEGRSDGPSIKNILKQVKPRNLVVVHGSREATDDLVDFCASDDDISEYLTSVFSPGVGERLDVTSERNIFQLKLTDSLVSSLKFSELHGYSIAWVTGVIARASDGTGADGGMRAIEVPNNQRTDGEEDGMGLTDPDSHPTTNRTASSTLSASEADGEEVDRPSRPGSPSANNPPAGTSNNDTPDIAIPVLTAPDKKHLAGHSAVFIGDVRLSNLKKVLEQHGIASHFSGGALICEDTVAVRLGAPQRGQPVPVSLEGCVGETYYAVRELLYAQFAIV